MDAGVSHHNFGNAKNIAYQPGLIRELQKSRFRVRGSPPIGQAADREADPSGEVRKGSLLSPVFALASLSSRLYRCIRLIRCSVYGMTLKRTHKTRINIGWKAPEK